MRQEKIDFKTIKSYLFETFGEEKHQEHVEKLLAYNEQTKKKVVTTKNRHRWAKGQLDLPFDSAAVRTDRKK